MSPEVASAKDQSPKSLGAKNEIINTFKTHEGDTGSPEVQICLVDKAY